jgi:hypothetical protein
LTFADAPAGTVSGQLSDVLFEIEAFGGVTFDAPRFLGAPTPEERAAELESGVPVPGNISASISLRSVASSFPIVFEGTSTATTITATWSDEFDRILPMGGDAGNGSATISLRRIR